MDEYAYINARIRAMQGRLLDRARYEALLAQSTVADLVQSLADSPYAQAMEWTAASPETTTPPDTGARIDEALRQDLVRCLSKLRRFTSGRPRELMEAVLLRWDAYNLKTLLRGKRAAAPIEKILASTFPVGNLDEIALAELTRTPTLRAVVDTLETWRSPMSRPLRQGLKLVGEADTLQPLEFELDRWTFSEALRVVANGGDNDHVVKSYLRLYVDKANLLTALRYLSERSALSPLEAGRHFLDAEGRFTRPQFDVVASARDLRHGLSLLGDTSYAWLASGLSVEQPVSLVRMERELDRMMIRETSGFRRREPLGIGVAVAYIEQKINEVRNLRMIARGKDLGMGGEQIAEWLII